MTTFLQVFVPEFNRSSFLESIRPTTTTTTTFCRNMAKVSKVHSLSNSHKKRRCRLVNKIKLNQTNLIYDRRRRRRHFTKKNFRFVREPDLTRAYFPCCFSSSSSIRFSVFSLTAYNNNNNLFDLFDFPNGREGGGGGVGSRENYSIFIHFFFFLKLIIG